MVQWLNMTMNHKTAILESLNLSLVGLLNTVKKKEHPWFKGHRLECQMNNYT